MTAAPRAATGTPNGPLAQSVRIAFRVLYGATAIMALVWATGNIRPVPPDSRAVVSRFGRIDRVQEAGLLIAWPGPIEEVRLLPARERQIELRIDGAPDAAAETGMVFQKEKNSSNASPETDIQITPNDDVILLRPQKDADNASYLLTANGSVVELAATLFYEITDPAAYMLAESHVQPALRRLYLAAAVSLAAARDLDDFLVARPDQAESPDIAARRKALRGDLVAGINRRLADLRRDGIGLGIEIGRVDLVAILPPVAKAAFDDVLTAAQTADQAAAAARTDAARIAQEADQRRDRTLAEAHAVAEEEIRAAITDTAAIRALETHGAAAGPDELMAETYRDRIGAIVRKIGVVTAVDLSGGQHLIAPGPPP